MLYFINLTKSVVLGGSLFIAYGLLDARIVGEFILWLTIIEVILIITDLGLGVRTLKLDPEDKLIREMATMQKGLASFGLVAILALLILIPREIHVAIMIYISGRLLSSFFAVDHAVALKSGLYFWDSVASTGLVIAAASVALIFAYLQAVTLTHVAIVISSQYLASGLTVVKGKSYMPLKITRLTLYSFEGISGLFALQSKYRPIIERLIAGSFLSPQEFALFARSRTIYDSALSALITTKRTRILLGTNDANDPPDNFLFFSGILILSGVAAIYFIASFLSNWLFNESWDGLSGVLLPAAGVSVISAILEISLAKRFVRRDMHSSPYIVIGVYIIAFGLFCSFFAGFGTLVVLYGMIGLLFITMTISYLL